MGRSSASIAIFLEQLLAYVINCYGGTLDSASLRGAGEPTFETGFPPGADMVGEILSSPAPEARIESELFSRLYG